MTSRIVAILPMRHSSERVAGKNYREFDGRPLYHHIVSTLLNCSDIHEILIDTDSEFILRDAKKFFPDVHLYRRPDHLSDGMTAMNDVLCNSIAQVEADFYLQTHSTNPLLRSATIGRAISTFAENLPLYDSLFSVTRLQTRLWNSKSEPINHTPNELLRTQDLEPIFEENSCLYLFSKESLLAHNNRIGERPFMFEIDPLEAQDIDEEVDFLVAEELFRIMQKGVN